MFCREDMMSLWFNDFVVDNEDIIFASGSFNGMFRANLKNGKATLIGRFPGEDAHSYHLYCKTHRYGNHVLFIPAWGKKFVVYDIKSNIFREILFETSFINELSVKYSFAFSASILVGKYAYVFGYDQPKIVRIDMERLDAIIYDDWIDKLYQFGKKEEAPFFYKDVCLVNNSLFLVTGQNNSIVELNLSDSQIYFHPIGADESHYNTIAYDGTYFWLTEQTKGFLYVNSFDWSYQYKKIEKYIHTDFFLYSMILDGTVLLFANWDENIFQICCADCSFNELEIVFGQEDRWYPYNEKYGYRVTKKISENRFAVFCAQDCEMHIFEGGKDIGRVKFYIEDKGLIDKIYKEKILSVWEGGCCIVEWNKKYFQLEDLFFFTGEYGKVYIDKNTDIGQNIYNYIKNE